MNFQYKSSGIVDGTDGKMLFCNDHYVFTFLSSELMPFGTSYTMNPEDGFLYMTSHQKKKYAFYHSKGSFSVSGDLKYHASFYVEADMANPDLDLSHFYKITFIGGVLDSLWHEHSLDVRYSEDGTETIKFEKTKKKYSFSVPDFSCKISIGLAMGGTEGTHTYTLTNQVYFSLEFDKDQPLAAVKKHYRQVKRLISVMTNNEETHFDTIFIYLTRDHPNPFFNRAYVHLLENDNEKLPEHYYRVISFDDLGASVGEVLSLFYNSKNRKPSYSLGFIPHNEEERWLVTENTVRALFSALECETAFDADVKAYQVQELRELCEDVKMLVKEHREKHNDKPVLSQGTYDLIFGSINHWSMSAFDKILLLYNKHRDALNAYQSKKAYTITEEDIHAFVKYRNSITHGNYQEMTDQVRNTTRAMVILVYCCFLARVGVPEEKIIEICYKGYWI